MFPTLANICKNISLSSKKYLGSDKWWPTTIFLGWMSPIVKIVDQFESWPPWATCPYCNQDQQLGGFGITKNDWDGP